MPDRETFQYGKEYPLFSTVEKPLVNQLYSLEDGGVYRYCSRKGRANFLNFGYNFVRSPDEVEKNRQKCAKYDNDPNKKRQRQMRRITKVYGLNKDEYLNLFKRCGNLCEMNCGNPVHPFTWYSHVDHQHIENFKDLPPNEKKKYVRGILCNKCNCGLGYYEKNGFKDRADEYLRVKGPVCKKARVC